jgi:predicted O-methyltransferase YrrM
MKKRNFAIIVPWEYYSNKIAKKIVSKDWLRIIVRNYLYTPTLILAAVKLKQKANMCKSIKDCFNVTSNFLNSSMLGRLSIRVGQFEQEITELLTILAKRRPTLIMEIGTASGGSLFLFSKISSPNAIIISIDLPNDKFGGGYSEPRILYYKSFATHNQKMHLVRKNSHLPSTLGTVKNILNTRKLDLLFIDGDHTYNGVRKDFEMYGKLVKHGGIIAFHDICPSPITGCGVNRYWNEIKSNYSYAEIVKDWKQGTAGIGIIYVP